MTVVFFHLYQVDDFYSLVLNYQEKILVKYLKKNRKFLKISVHDFMWQQRSSSLTLLIGFIYLFTLWTFT